jgi:hypothetical protein
MAYMGSWKVDDLLTFACNTHTVTTGAATDADAVPSYRVYEDETGTAILNGSMAKLDDANTTGFYSEQITLSAANGFEKGKCYTVYISATVNSVVGTMHHTFQLEAEVDANAVSNIGANVITAASIATGAIDADAIADNAIDAGAIAADAITAAKIADGAIDAATFAAGAINAAAIAADAITAAKIADGAIDAATFAAGAINAAAIAADAIGASELAADAVTEIANAVAAPTAATVAAAVWDRDATGHQTQGTFGQAIGDPAADTNTIYGAVVTGATGATIAADIITIDDFLDTEVAAIKAKTDNLPADPADASDIAASFTTVNTALTTIDDFLDTEIAAIKAKTDNLPADPADASDIAASFVTVNAALTTIDDFLDTEVAAIKTKTDQLAFTTANRVDAQVFGMEANTLTAAASAADFVTEIQANLSTLTEALVQSNVIDALDEILPDSVPADGTRPTVRQSLYMIVQFLMEKSVSGTTVTTKKVDGSTSLMTHTLDSATDPTSITRTT